MRTARFILLGVAIALSAVGLVSARVFHRSPAPAGARGRLQQIGLQTVYTADVVLNGGAGYFEVGLLDGEPGDAVRRLAPQPESGATPWLHQVGPQFASAAAVDAEGFTRILAFALPDRPQTAVFCFTQSRADAARSARPPHTPPDGIPLFPGHTLLTTWENRDTRSRAAVAETEAEPAAISEFYRQHYRNAGWTELSPTPQAGVGSQPGTGLRIYAKGAELILVGIQSRTRQPGQILTVLHKSLESASP